MIKVNGGEYAHVPGRTIAALLEEMDYSISTVAVECNGEIVPRKMLQDKIVEDHDTLEIVCFVGGG